MSLALKQIVKLNHNYNKFLILNSENQEQYRFWVSKQQIQSFSVKYNFLNCSTWEISRFNHAKSHSNHVSIPIKSRFNSSMTNQYFEKTYYEHVFMVLFFYHDSSQNL